MTQKLPDEIEAVLEGWSLRSRRLFHELMEDATSELQQELVQRALLAGHTPGEVHAFADELRGLSDEACFEACTLDDDAPEGYTVAQLLRAESDPLFAYEVKGGALTPNEDDDAPSVPLSPQRPEVMEARDDRARQADPVRRAMEQRQGFDASSGRFPAVASSRSAALGGAPVSPSGQLPAPAPLASGRLFEDLLTDATRAMGVTWREVELEVAGGLTIAQGLNHAAAALARSIPVPCVIGNAQGRPLRFVLMLQSSTSGTSRAFQLYEPFSQELIWANEKDLLARGELPFDNKALRTLLRMALPTGRSL